MEYVISGKIVYKDRVERGVVVVEDGTISYVGKKDRGYGGAERIRYDNCYISAGFIDIHVHGGGGADTMAGKVEAIKRMSVTHLSGGTTSLYPTTLTAPMDKIVKALKSVRKAMKNKTSGAKVLGAHLEGPYLSYEERGAQNHLYLKNPEREEYEQLVYDFRDVIARVSAAPELNGAMELGEFLRDNGVVASIAHSNARYEDVILAVKAGYSHVTHLYCGMSKLKIINAYLVPGVLESTLLINDLTTEIIADNHHVPAPLIKLAIKCKGIDKIALVTDAIGATGLQDGNYRLGELDIVVKGGVAKLMKEQSFAGSVITMNTAVKNMVKVVGLPIYDAVRMATEIPAKIMGIADKKGTLSQGKDADIIVFDKDFNILIAMVEGEILYRDEQFNCR